MEKSKAVLKYAKEKLNRYKICAFCAKRGTCGHASDARKINSCNVWVFDGLKNTYELMNPPKK